MPAYLILLIVLIFAIAIYMGPMRRVREARRIAQGEKPHTAPRAGEAEAQPTPGSYALGHAEEQDAPDAAPTRVAVPPTPTGTPYQLKPETLALAYTVGAKSERSDRGADGASEGQFTFSNQEIGLLEVSSGAVAASDPLVNPSMPPFTRAVPKGRFPVRIAIAANAGGDERIAYAKVVFSEAPPVQWELALIDGQDVATLGKDEFFGYGVDAGTGCFMDPRAGALLEAKMDEVDDYFEVIIEEMDKTYAHTRSWVDLRPDPKAPENVICFSSGWGDGSYPSFFGLDAEGKPAVLVTDFMVV